MQLQLDGYLVVGVQSGYQIFTKILFYVDKVSPMHPLIVPKNEPRDKEVPIK
jgi:hypothetical protein